MNEQEKLALIQQEMDKYPNGEFVIKKSQGVIVDFFSTDHLHWELKRSGERRNLVVLTGIQTTPIL